MQVVVSLDRYRRSQTVQLLEALAEKARTGEIIGVAMCFRREDGSEECVSSGHFAHSPDGAAAAALRLSLKLAGSRGEYDRSP